MTTEIYICRDGQELKQGKLEYSDDIDDRESADIDAKRRCQRDRTIKKVAYYRVSNDGEFRVFYSYTNPDCKPAAKAAPAAVKTKPAVAKKKKPPPGLLARLRKSIGF